MSSKLLYLQKYLSKGDSLLGENLKKKSGKISKIPDKYRSRIIDLDEAFLEKNPGTGKDEEIASDNEERYTTLEEQPQVAGFVDERPEIEIMKEKFTTSTFQAIVKVENEDGSENFTSNMPTLSQVKVKEEPPDSGDEKRAKHSRRKRHDSSDSDESPPRKTRHNSRSDTLPPRRHRKQSFEASPPKRTRHDSSDESPPRRTRHDSSDVFLPRRRRGQSSDDMSPPRKRRRNSSDQCSTSFLSNIGSDLSHPRKLPAIKTEIKAEEDMYCYNDLSRIEKRQVKEVDSDGDISPPRIQPREDQTLLSKTLDGKKAGLQHAKSLKEELSKIRRREKETFQTLDTEKSGKYAETRVRGRLKEKQEIERKKKEENEITDEVKKKYTRWGKGIKQSEAIQQRIAEDLREMDKPLARSADDVDLDSQLKGIQREEDPMLDYIRKKQAKSSRAKKMPTYKRPVPAPNRFKILPGYRWDGVDRSNGFEKKLFERQNASKAMEEDAYKWSTEDM